jgi:DnaJ-class molecular chaperone
MTPSAIRAAAKQTHFSVVCDSCHGHLFRDGVLCWKCNGNGRVLVPDRRVTVYVSRRMVRTALILGIAICMLALAAISILS